MTFREQIQALMQERGVTAYQLAKDTGVNEGQLSRFFKGDGSRGLSIPALTKVLDYLGYELKITKKKGSP